MVFWWWWRVIVKLACLCIQHKVRGICRSALRVRRSHRDQKRIWWVPQHVGLKHHSWVHVFILLFSSQEISGRQFLSVVDLEDKTLHQDLPPHLSPGATEFTPVYASPPTSAQLHLLAVSVIQSTTGTSEPQPSFPVPADLQQPTTHTGISGEDHHCLLNVSQWRQADLCWN